MCIRDRLMLEQADDMEYETHPHGSRKLVGDNTELRLRTMLAAAMGKSKDDVNLNFYYAADASGGLLYNRMSHYFPLDSSTDSDACQAEYCVGVGSTVGPGAGALWAELRNLETLPDAQAFFEELLGAKHTARAGGVLRASRWRRPPGGALRSQNPSVANACSRSCDGAVKRRPESERSSVGSSKKGAPLIDSLASSDLASSSETSGTTSGAVVGVAASGTSACCDATSMSRWRSGEAGAAGLIDDPSRRAAATSRNKSRAALSLSPEMVEAAQGRNRDAASSS